MRLRRQNSTSPAVPDVLHPEIVWQRSHGFAMGIVSGARNQRTRGFALLRCAKSVGVRVRRFRNIWALVIAFAMLVGAGTPAPAAELRISLTELARILAATLGDATLRLHNVPGGTFNFTPGSSLKLGSTSVPIPIPARSFVVGGTTYAFYVNDLNSKKIAISAVPGALRFTITFDDTGPEVVGRCLSGFCVSDSSLPEIEWNAPMVTFDLVPVSVGGNLSLVAKRVDVSGTFAPDCNAATGIFSGSLCKIVLPQARKATANLKTDLNAALMTQLNAPELQAKLASALGGVFKFGPAGQVTFSKVAVDSDNVTMTFCLVCQTQ